eukprot:1185798-Prorocentrum_minimum.AAC.3
MNTWNRQPGFVSEITTVSGFLGFWVPGEITYGYTCFVSSCKRGLNPIKNLKPLITKRGSPSAGCFAKRSHAREVPTRVDSRAEGWDSRAEGWDSPSCFAKRSHANEVPTSEEEQAVSMEMASPRIPKVYASRPHAIPREVPVPIIASGACTIKGLSEFIRGLSGFVRGLSGFIKGLSVGKLQCCARMRARAIICWVGVSGFIRIYCRVYQGLSGVIRGLSGGYQGFIRVYQGLSGFIAGFIRGLSGFIYPAGEDTAVVGLRDSHEGARAGQVHR